MHFAINHWEVVNMTTEIKNKILSMSREEHKSIRLIHAPLIRVSHD